VSELFNEVDEEVRREQLKKLWDRYSIYIVVAAILVVAAVGGWRGYEYLEAQKAAEASAAFDAAIELADQNKGTEAEAAFDKVATTAPSGYRMLARLRAAGEVAARDPKVGAKLYDDLAADRSIGAEQQDLARIRSAGLLLDTDTYPNILQRLEAAAKPEATFRHTARELLALSAWRANDTTAARQWLDMIANDGETPSAMRQRAESLQALLPPAAKS
jgi:hypothetical protein